MDSGVVDFLAKNGIISTIRDCKLGAGSVRITSLKGFGLTTLSATVTTSRELEVPSNLSRIRVETSESSGKRTSMDPSKLPPADLLESLGKISRSSADLKMEKTTGENLDVDYCVLWPKGLADGIARELEDSVKYYEGSLTKVKVFGKWHEIPRQQVAYGDDGIKYTFSGVTVPAKTWTPLLKEVKQMLSRVTGFEYNFVLINRYRNGNDHIGEHRDAEKEIDENTPIASLSLGQKRTFVLKHGDARKKGPAKRNVPTVKMELEHGSLLLMNPPTNDFWYHSVPQRKSANGVRINLTFRKINM